MTSPNYTNRYLRLDTSFFDLRNHVLNVAQQYDAYEAAHIFLYDRAHITLTDEEWLFLINAGHHVWSTLNKSFKSNRSRNRFMQLSIPLIRSSLHDFFEVMTEWGWGGVHPVLLRDFYESKSYVPNRNSRTESYVSASSYFRHASFRDLQRYAVAKQMRSFSKGLLPDVQTILDSTLVQVETSDVSVTSLSRDEFEAEYIARGMAGAGPIAKPRKGTRLHRALDTDYLHILRLQRRSDNAVLSYELLSPFYERVFRFRVREDSLSRSLILSVGSKIGHLRRRTGSVLEYLA